MNIYDSRDTIIACSTGLTSNTAIGILRISGSNFLEDLFKIVDLDLTKLKKRYAHFCRIVYDGILYDEVVLTYFKGPHSYNGEDIIEIAVHGNQINIDRIINLICNVCNFRKANPGEFTQRALKNKKLNFAQVEGLDLLLNANSIFSLEQGFSLLSGSLKKDFQALYDLYIKHRSTLEMGFDFLDDIGEEQFNALFKTSLSELDNHIRKLYKRCLNMSGSLIQPDIALFGKPNAGKSSLFNLLVGDDRAIVSEVAGTTRDFLSEKIKINGQVFNIFDTAGLRTTSDSIEKMGINKAIEKIEFSFFKILLVDCNLIGVNEFDQKHLNNIDLVIFSHFDKGKESKSFYIDSFNFLFKSMDSNSILNNEITGPIEPKSTGPIEPKNTGPIEPKSTGPIEPKSAGPIEPKNTGPIEPKSAGPIEPKNTGPIEPKSAGPIEPKSAGPIEPREISYIFADLLSNSNDLDVILKGLVFNKFNKFLDFDPILIERHKDNINKIYLSFLQYQSCASKVEDMAIISSELNIVGHCISELIGIVSPDDVLNNLFSNFCIGK